MAFNLRLCLASCYFKFLNKKNILKCNRYHNSNILTALTKDRWRRAFHRTQFLAT
jgi:hypothetical protein